MKDRTKKGLLDLLLLLAGTLLLAFAVKCIYEPLDMVTGGFSGLAILIKAVTEHMVPGGIPLGVSSLLLNIPVFLWAFRKDICRKVFCCDDPVVTLAVYPAGMESGRG